MALLGNAPNFVRTPQNPCTGQDFWREPSGAHEATGLSGAAGNGASGHSAVLLQQRNQVSDSPGVEGGGVELVLELNKSASTLELSASSRSISLLSCLIRCSCAIFRFSYSISLRLNSISLSS